MARLPLLRWTTRPGWRGVDWKSRTRIFGIPLIHVAAGFDERGRMRVAKGFIAIGQFAFGVIAIGQIGVGALFSFSQIAVGLFAVGQLSAGLLISVGMMSVGTVAIGLLAAGLYAVGLLGYGTYLWTLQRTDMEAVALLHTIYLKFIQLLGLQ